MGGEIEEGFWTVRGVRRGCPLSPLLFNILMANIEEEMGRVNWRGFRIRGKRMYTLAYADDVVMMAAEGENEMRSMIERLEG